MRTPIKFEKRPAHGWLASVFSTCVAIFLALLASSVLLWIVDVDVYGAFHALVLGAFGDLDSIYGTCVKAIPLAFTGLATGIAFRARIWNIGQEGQVFAGAMLGYWLSITVDLPGIVFFPTPHGCRICRRGCAWRLAGVLKTRFSVDEIVSTVMMNYIIVFVLSYLLTSRLWMAPGEYYLQTAQIPEAQRIPILMEGTKLSLAFPLAIAAVLGVHVLLSRTTFGYELRAFGSNPNAARFKGTDPGRMLVTVMLVSGGLAGLGA